MLHHALREQERERNRQVEGGTLLADIRGGEVDDDARRGKGQARVADRRTHPLPRLLHGGVGKPDDHHAGKPSGDVDLDLDSVGVDAQKGGGGQFGKHPISLRRAVRGRDEKSGRAKNQAG